MKNLYYKVTKDNGVSGSDSTFIYKIGMNIHPSPDKNSKESCGVGIHLAKTLTSSLRYVPDATEFYLAESGVILGEDKDKVRCISCNIVKQLSKSTTTRILKREAVEKKRAEEKLLEELEVRKLLGSIIFDTGGLCGKDWLRNHSKDVTQEDIDNCRLEVDCGNQRFSMSLKMRRKDRKFLLKEALA